MENHFVTIVRLGKMRDISREITNALLNIFYNNIFVTLHICCDIE